MFLRIFFGRPVQPMISRLMMIACPFLLLLMGCRDSDHHLFTKLSASSSGVSFKNILKEDDEFNVLNYPYFYNGGGVAVGDINNDGLPDLLFTGNMVKNRLYLNKGNCKFEDITAQSTVAEKQGWCTGAGMADVNADGWLDLYICRSADVDPVKRKNLLYINNHDNTFTEQAEQYGIADQGYSTHAAFFDYDRDNDLDLVVINHSSKQYMKGVQETPGIRQQTNPDFSTHLYRNDNEHFTNVTAGSGITSNLLTFGLGIAVSDLDNDGWPDLYISNDFNEADYCFMNQRNGTFREMGAGMFSYTSLFSMGNAAADLNNDGLQDVVTLDMLPEGNYLQKMHNGSENFDKFQILFNSGFWPQYSRNMLQLNRGDGSFDEIGQFSGVSNTDWSWAPLAADFDNDGKKDLFITNGYVKDYTDMDYIKYNVDIILEKDPKKQQKMMSERMDKLPTIKTPNYMFKNEDGIRFSNQTASWGLEEPVISAGAAYADLDNDGDLDIILNNCNEQAGIYRNDLRQQNDSSRYLDIKLTGKGQNPFAVGAKITLKTTAGIQVQELMPSRGFQSSVDYLVHFGMGNKDSALSLDINWPNGQVSTISAPGMNKTIHVHIPDAAPAPSQTGSHPPPPLFSQLDSLEFAHKENNYNDFTQQSLLPQWFSRQGPALAKGDIDGDKLEDVFIGGAKGQAGVFFIQDRDGRLRKQNDPALAADAAYEDITAAIFDADGDGDNDLFVGSGGYELSPDDPLLQNRLYLNNGKGRFIRAVNALPRDLVNDNALTVADFNNDGFPDIFNGGFCVPGKYPESSGSQLLLNNGKGIFSKAPWLKDFNQQNLVTSSVAADIDKDGKTDLVITGHWMGIEVWLNKTGYFEKDSTLLPAGTKGLFNVLAADDLDDDGDIDIVAGNQGLNDQFRTTGNEPLEMYYGDFDDNGTREPVIAYYIDHKSWPIYSRDDLVQQIPSYNKRFLYYSDYAKADMKTIFGEKLARAAHYQAPQMASLLLENNGKRFSIHELPLEAQWYPLYAISVADLNKDGKKDLVIGGNETYARIKFGAYGCGKGDVLINKGNCRFERMPPALSGLKVEGDIWNSVVVGNQVVFGINNRRALCFRLSSR